MTIEQLMGLVGKTGRIVPTNGKPEWPGPFTVVAVDCGRVALDEIAGHRYSGPTLDVESVARRVQTSPMDGRRSRPRSRRSAPGSCRRTGSSPKIDTPPRAVSAGVPMLRGVHRGEGAGFASLEYVAFGKHAR